MSLSKRIEFSTIREEWNVYQLNNGTILKVKMPLAALMPDEEKKETGISTTTLTFVDPVPEDLGSPSPNITVAEQDIVGEITFTRIRQPVNIYETRGGTLILIIPYLIRVRRTTKFNAQGVRIYDIALNVATSVVPYPKELKSENKAEPAQPS